MKNVLPNIHSTQYVLFCDYNNYNQSKSTHKDLSLFHMNIYIYIYFYDGRVCGFSVPWQAAFFGLLTPKMRENWGWWGTYC